MKMRKNFIVSALLALSASSIAMEEPRFVVEAKGWKGAMDELHSHYLADMNALVESSPVMQNYLKLSGSGAIIPDDVKKEIVSEGNEISIQLARSLDIKVTEVDEFLEYYFTNRNVLYPEGDMISINEEVDRMVIHCDLQCQEEIRMLNAMSVLYDRAVAAGASRIYDTYYVCFTNQAHCHFRENRWIPALTSQRSYYIRSVPRSSVREGKVWLEPTEPDI